MLTIELQLAIIDRQIREWQEAAFNAEIAHKVHTKLKTSRLSEFENNLTQAEIAIAELQTMRAAVAGPQQEG